MPERHILVCEDVLRNQADIATYFSKLFEHEGLVQVSIVAGGEAAAGIIANTPVDLILLDHDMPFGNGPDLLAWIKSIGKAIPVLTFSGLPPNNDLLMAAGANHKFTKVEVLSGLADAIIHEILGISRMI
jgi:CheY-like chemotaxis protein